MNPVHEDYYFVGHLCHDKTESGYALGGTASFGASWVSSLGFNAVIYTAFGPEFLFENELVDYKVYNTGSESTTSFLNVYKGNNRSQFVLNKASNIDEGKISIPSYSSIVHLAPIFEEFSVKIIDSFHPQTFVGVTPQGWLRQKDEESRISSKTMHWPWLDRANAVIMSDEECPREKSDFEKLQNAVRLLVITKNEMGAHVYTGGEQFHFPSFPVTAINKSGAGDVFSSVFFADYYITGDVQRSTIKAHCAASLHVENMYIPNEKKLCLLNERVSQYMDLFSS